MTLTCHGCGATIYPPRRRWCWRCAAKEREQQSISRWQRMTPEDREEHRRVNRLKAAADRPPRVCYRCRAPLRGGKGSACDKCCGKRALQKRLAERARRARVKGEGTT